MNALIRPLDEIILQPPAGITRWTLYAVIGLLTTLVVWSIFARLDVVTIAEGRLVPETLVKIVQPAEAGVIRDILVKDGDHVRTGQTLIRMNAEVLDADRRTTEMELRTRALALRRIDAELRDAPLLSRSSDDGELFNKVLAQYGAHRKAYLDALSQEDATIERTAHDLAAARQIFNKLKATVPIYQETARAYRNLATDGFVSDMALREKERDRIEREQDLLSQASSVDSMAAALEQAKRKRDQVVSAYHSQLQNERVEVEGQSSKYQEDRLKAEYRAGLYELKAPQDGVVKDMATTTTGAVVSPGTVLLSLVPIDEPLVADVAIRNEDVSFLAPGLPVKVKVAAYPFQKYGMLDGKVERIASDASESRNTDANAPRDQPNYRAEVRLARQNLVAASGEVLPISPGMRVSAEVRQRDQTVLEYVLSPVQKVVAEAGHER